MVLNSAIRGSCCTPWLLMTEEIFPFLGSGLVVHWLGGIRVLFLYMHFAYITSTLIYIPAKRACKVDLQQLVTQ